MILIWTVRTAVGAVRNLIRQDNEKISRIIRKIMYNTDYQKWNTNIKAGKQDGEDRTKQNISYKSVD